ncbi:uncharacterized protein VDAG_06750 [Verticillium dahliae VdLs.17]|uniref:Uncharacterized protein n=1 Tax=Verticillium dahliae (strain VdLs.17 / ATCC MYA-4575 / FGSC 10137) TaxID=498257 RepID=G2X9B8_VERDV|nr:uncharacterized protein VDAG_06750 [Verticillium dahliae VdLs.17]EGY15586.1 hypothetical protein VDAG_06750 [Verticillium dahliae VdLs.17]
MMVGSPRWRRRFRIRDPGETRKLQGTTARRTGRRPIDQTTYLTSLTGYKDEVEVESERGSRVARGARRVAMDTTGCEMRARQSDEGEPPKPPGQVRPGRRNDKVECGE